MLTFDSYQTDEFKALVKKAVKEAIKEKDYEKRNIEAIKAEDWLLP